MEIQELAQKVIESTSESDRSKTGYYMTNINHPVIAALLRRFREKNGLTQPGPLSDPDRIEFELWLFQPSVRVKVENIINERGRKHD